MPSNLLQQFIYLPLIYDDAHLSVAEEKSLPFHIKRLYYIYDSELDLPRGFHAHKETTQLLFCIKGSITMVLDDGKTKEKFTLDKSNQGVLLKPLIWHEMHDFTKETILLILASHEYDPSDYIRDYQQFLEIVNRKKVK